MQLQTVAHATAHYVMDRANVMKLRPGRRLHQTGGSASMRTARNWCQLCN